jgi:hypothetical protein
MDVHIHGGQTLKECFGKEQVTNEKRSFQSQLQY